MLDELQLLVISCTQLRFAAYIYTRRQFLCLISSHTAGSKFINCFGRAVVQAVSRQLPTVDRVRALVKSRGICGGQSGTGAGILLVLRFHLPPIPPTAPHSSSSIRGWYSRPNSGRRTKWTQSHPTAETKKN
jgi:hypothetical protein